GLLREHDAREQQQVLGPLLGAQRLEERRDQTRLLERRRVPGSAAAAGLAPVAVRTRSARGLRGVDRVPRGALPCGKSVRSTSRQNACPMAMWPSWTFGVASLGV